MSSKETDKMGELTTERRAQDNDAAAAKILEAQNPKRTFARPTTVRHPDTTRFETFKEGDEVPDWATSVLGPDNFKVEDSDAKAPDPGPVPESGQNVPNNLVGDKLYADAPTRAEDTAAAEGSAPKTAKAPRTPSPS